MEKKTSVDSGLYSRYLIGQARDLMVKARQKELKPYNITPQQCNILAFLYDLDHKATLREIAGQAGRGHNTISTQMTLMERDELIKKIRQTPKSTLLTFELTQKGIDIYKNAKKMRSVKTVMSVLSEDEHQQLISLLQKIISKAKNFK